MATPTVERTVLPPAEPLEALAAMLGSLGAEPITTLWGPNGEHLGGCCFSRRVGTRDWGSCLVE